MTLEKRQGLRAKQTLTADELSAAKDLLQLCNAYDGLDLKVSLDIREVGEVQDRVNVLLCYEDDALVGLCTLDGIKEVEICGMVHPEQRRQGSGSTLLAAALDRCRQRGSERALLICEDASQAGQTFVASHNGRQAFTEHRMEIEASQVQPHDSDGARVTLRKAGPEDVDTLARIIASAFADPEEDRRHDIVDDMADPHQVFYLGKQEQTPVGSLKVFFSDERAFIYAFGVLPDYRRKGLGRAILTQTIQMLGKDGWSRVALEVDTQNAPAVALYRSTGFTEITTYGYYELAL